MNIANFYSEHFLIVWYLVIINLVAFFFYGLDKAKAEGGSWRIKEIRLLFLALIGGTVGAMAGMKVFRHKTKKIGFLLPFIIILAIQIGLIYFFLTNFY